MPSIRSLPAALRPRERLLNGGEPCSLTELLAVLLGTGSASQDVLSLAEKVGRMLLDGERSPAALAELEGVGISKALRVVAALRLSEAVEATRMGSGALNDPRAIYEAMADLLQEPQEHLVAFHVSVRGQRLRRIPITVGTLTSSLIHPREVFRPAILGNAATLVLAHNHPSGIPDPSEADLRATRTLAEAGRLLGIELSDHVVCAGLGFVSMREQYPDLFVASGASFC